MPNEDTFYTRSHRFLGVQLWVIPITNSGSTLSRQIVLTFNVCVI